MAIYKGTIKEKPWIARKWGDIDLLTWIYRLEEDLRKEKQIAVSREVEYERRR